MLLGKNDATVCIAVLVLMLHHHVDLSFYKICYLCTISKLVHKRLLSNWTIIFLQSCLNNSISSDLIYLHLDLSSNIRWELEFFFFNACARWLEPSEKGNIYIYKLHTLTQILKRTYIKLMIHFNCIDLNKEKLYS